MLLRNSTNDGSHFIRSSAILWESVLSSGFNPKSQHLHWSFLPLPIINCDKLPLHRLNFDDKASFHYEGTPHEILYCYQYFCKFGNSNTIYKYRTVQKQFPVPRIHIRIYWVPDRSYLVQLVFVVTINSTGDVGRCEEIDSLETCGKYSSLLHSQSLRSHKFMHFRWKLLLQRKYLLVGKGA